MGCTTHFAVLFFFFSSWLLQGSSGSKTHEDRPFSAKKLMRRETSRKSVAKHGDLTPQGPKASARRLTGKDSVNPIAAGLSPETILMTKLAIAKVAKKKMAGTYALPAMPALAVYGKKYAPAPNQQQAMPAGYSKSGSYSNACESGFAKLPTQQACIDFAALWGKSMSDLSPEDASWTPGGCYWDSVASKVLWNSNAGSSDCSKCYPLCGPEADSPSSAPTPNPTPAPTPPPVIYFLETGGTNACTSGRSKLASKLSCQNASKALGKYYEAEEDLSNYPGGCYVFGGTSVYWNWADPSSDQHESEPICTTDATTNLVTKSSEACGSFDDQGVFSTHCEAGQCLTDPDGISTCAKCVSPYYLSKDGSCVERCSVGWEEMEHEDGNRECKMCYGETRRRVANTPTECKGCPNGEIAWPDQDDCQNIQDTCESGPECDDCLTCLGDHEQMVRDCLADKDPQATCLFPGMVWCDQLHVHCQHTGASNYGCFFKLRCQSPCICDAWKDINCGDQKVPQNQTLCDGASLLAKADKTNRLMQRSLANTGNKESFDTAVQGKVCS